MKDYDYERNPSPWSDSSRIKRIVIEKGVTSVGQDAFYSCTALESVRIPGSVRNVGSYAFGLCESLTRVSLPKSVKSIGKLGFGACTELQEISVAKGNRYFSSADGVLYNKKQTRLLQFPAAKGGKFKMPGSVKKVESEVFQFCFHVTNTTISGKMTRIPADAFTYCTKLRTVVIPSRVKSIGSRAFEDCAEHRGHWQGHEKHL